MIDTLIDKQDNFEIIRDQITAILVNEVASQMSLATASGKNPNNWKLRVFKEQSNPFEQFLNGNPTSDTSPIINVWFDSFTTDPKASNTSERQKVEAVYNIDCYGFGQSANLVAGGHTKGDVQAATEVHRAARLVRNILMAAEYTYLNLRGTVWARWLQNITSFQPQIEGQQVQKIHGLRLVFNVGFSEFSPQITPETLEIMANTVKSAESGEIILEANYVY